MKPLPVKTTISGANIWSYLNLYSEEEEIFPTRHLNQCKNNPNEPQNIPNEIKSDLFYSYGTGVIFTSGHDPPKGVRW